jgi:hypothetical protein
LIDVAFKGVARQVSADIDASRRYNQRILRGDAESEDVMQDAYVRAYQHLDQFVRTRAVSDLADAYCGTRSADACPQAQTQSATERLRGGR